MICCLVVSTRHTHTKSLCYNNDFCKITTGKTIVLKQFIIHANISDIIQDTMKAADAAIKLIK